MRSTDEEWLHLPTGTGRSIPPHGHEVLEMGAGRDGDGFRGRQLFQAEPPILIINLGTRPFKVRVSTDVRTDSATLIFDESSRQAEIIVPEAS